MDDKVELYTSVRMYGDETTITRVYKEDVSWSELVSDFIGTLNNASFQIKSRVIEIDENGAVVSDKHRGRD
jgi:hypothetical protein